MGFFKTGAAGAMRGRARPSAVPRGRSASQGGVGTPQARGRRLSPIVGRAIGVVVLCLLVGLLLTHLGIAARGILTDTWYTILSVGRLLGDVVLWVVPYTLLGAVVVVPLLILGLVAKRGPWR